MPAHTIPPTLQEVGGSFKWLRFSSDPKLPIPYPGEDQAAPKQGHSHAAQPGTGRNKAAGGLLSVVVGLALPCFPRTLSHEPTIQLETEHFQHHFTSPGRVAGDGRGLQPPKLMPLMKGFRQEPAGVRQGHGPAELSSLFGWFLFS